MYNNLVQNEENKDESSSKEIIWDNPHHPSDPAQVKTIKCYIIISDEENLFSHSMQGKKLIQSTLKCQFNAVGEVNIFSHSTHENMTKCSTPKCLYNTADDKNHFSHSAQEKALKCYISTAGAMVEKEVPIAPVEKKVPTAPAEKEVPIAPAEKEVPIIQTLDLAYSSFLHIGTSREKKKQAKLSVADSSAPEAPQALSRFGKSQSWRMN